MIKLRWYGPTFIAPQLTAIAINLIMLLFGERNPHNPFPWSMDVLIGALLAFYISLALLVCDVVLLALAKCPLPIGRSAWIGGIVTTVFAYLMFMLGLKVCLLIIPPSAFFVRFVLGNQKMIKK
jgi:hypothetical protein